MFDLKKYLKEDSNINESFQSTTLSKEIVSNPANNFNYLTTYSSNNSSAAEYTLNGYMFRNSKVGEIIMSPHDAEDLNSKRLFKYVPFGKYIHDLVYFLSIYAKYKNGVEGVTKEIFMTQYRRYMIIYRQWEKALNKGIFGNDTTGVQILEYTLGEPISDLTDSNFRKYTFKEAKKLGGKFTAMKKGAVLFFFSSGNFKSPDHTITAKTIDLPDGGLIGISVGNRILYDITRNYYSDCKEAVQAMKDYGFKDLYKLEMNDGTTLEIPYLCGLKNFVHAKLGEGSDHEGRTDPTSLSPFCKTFVGIDVFFKNRKFWQQESLSEIYDVDLKDLSGAKGQLCMQDMKSILDEMDIYDFTYNDFKFSFNAYSLNDPGRFLGNVFDTTSDPAFGGWGENPDDYVYVFMKDLEYPKGRFDDPDDSYHKKWNSGEFVPYVCDTNANQFLNSGKGEINDDITAPRLSRLDKEFIYKSSNSSKEDYRAGRVKHGYMMTPEEIQIKQNNLQRYANKLDALRNVNKDTRKYVDKIKRYKDFLTTMEDAIDNYMDYDIVDDIREFKFKAAKNYYSNVFKDRYEMQKSLIMKRTNFIDGLTELANLVLQFSQSNKNMLAGKYHDAALDLSTFYRERLVGYGNTGKLCNMMTDEDCSNLDFQKVYKKMKEDIDSQCEIMDLVVKDFENLQK